MNKNITAIFVRLTVYAVALFIVNFLFYKIPVAGLSDEGFIYALPVTYLFFFAFSAIIIGILIAVAKKNKEQLGYAFLLLTGIKMALSYVFARPVINKLGENPTEKINFFVIFILFLIIEAYYTARLLNNK